MTAIGWVLGGLLAWVALALAAAVILGKAIQRRDCCPHVDLDDEFVRLPTGGLFL